MSPEDARQLLPVITAFANGEVVQVLHIDTGWTDAADLEFHCAPHKYRVKPIEPHDIKWAAEQMSDGKKVRRRCWEGVHCCRKGGLAVQFYLDSGSRSQAAIDVDDIAGDDWELYEPK